MKIGLLAAALFAGAVSAHEVKLEQSSQSATVLRLSYADGQPLAFEAYELYLPGKETPEQVGRTNAQGQIVFLPGASAEWRVKAFSSDGHGIDQKLRLSTMPSAVQISPAAESGLSRGSLLLVGLGIIFGLFGLLQLSMKKKQK